MKIFVANLPYHINNEAIVQLFGLFGAVISAKIITKNGKSKGFGFLEMENDQQAEQAIRQLDGSPIDDRNMIVRAADDQSPQQSQQQKIHKRPRIAFTKI
jgi:RNA recognition motif-containing protein